VIYLLRSILLVLLVSGLNASAFAKGKLLTVPSRIPIQEGTSVSQKVLDECGIENFLAKRIAKEAKGPYRKVQMEDAVSSMTPGHALEVRIVQVHAPGGGKWSGVKILGAEGTLYVDSQVTGTFRAKRMTRHGRHTCRMLEKNAEEIAEDISRWLKKPVMDARLGDAD